MIVSIFAVYDSKGRTFGQPFFAISKEVALRSVRSTVQDARADSLLSRYPEDFTLYALGTFNDDTAEFLTDPQPHNLGSLAQFKNGAITHE